MTTAPYAYSLRDIHGPDPVAWWPPAPGWWLLALALAALLWLAWRYRPQIRIAIRSPWRWDAARRLRDLRRRARHQDLKTTAQEFSELVRRIGIARYGRSACAGLAGENWLLWLQEHDRSGFPWAERGRLLLEAPYAPPVPRQAEADRLLELIDAALAWLGADLQYSARGAKAGV